MDSVARKGSIDATCKKDQPDPKRRVREGRNADCYLPVFVPVMRMRITISTIQGRCRLEVGSTTPREGYPVKHRAAEGGTGGPVAASARPPPSSRRCAFPEQIALPADLSASPPRGMYPAWIAQEINPTPEAGVSEKRGDAKARGFEQEGPEGCARKDVHPSFAILDASCSLLVLPSVTSPASLRAFASPRFAFSSLLAPIAIHPQPLSTPLHFRLS